MIVTFSSLDEYLEELKSCTERSAVRAQVASEEINECVKEISAVSGFHDDRYFYELTLPCGQDVVGAPLEATQKAEAAIARIKAFCEEHGYGFRGGMWQTPE